MTVEALQEKIDTLNNNLEALEQGLNVGHVKEISAGEMKDYVEVYHRRVHDIVNVKTEIQRLEQQLNSHPGAWDEYKMWVVDIRCTKADAGLDVLAVMTKNIGLLADPNFLRNNDKLASAIVDDVKNQLSMEPMDQGVGIGKWFMGYYCTEWESRRLCHFIHKEYEAYLDLNVMTLQRIFWKVAKVGK